MTKPEASEILSKLVEHYSEETHPTTLAEVIELLENNHDIQSQFGNWRPSSGGRFAGVKNMIQQKLANIVIAVTRPAIRKQEKFNQLTLQALKLLQQQRDEPSRSQSN